jgi:hypothetical protein
MQGNQNWRKRLRIQDRNEEMKEENDNEEPTTQYNRLKIKNEERNWEYKGLKIQTEERD